MLAQSLRFPADAGPLRQGEWVFERKLDGLRCIATRRGPQVELWSRNHLSWNHRFPALVADLAAVPVESFVIDGEIVAFLGDQTSFQLLQGGQGVEPVLVAFDLLHLLGQDTSALPLLDRADLLQRTLATSPAYGNRLRTSGHLDGGVDELMAAACARGWEGLVAKRAGSTYRSGRSPDWRKLKCKSRQELVIGGWTEPAGARTAFGALLLGYHENGRLVYAGKVGTGFDERTLRALHARLRGLTVADAPFDDPPRERAAHWVRPELVAEIAFTEWTRDGRLRHPSFVGLREDKAATEVVRETPHEQSTGNT